MVAGSAPRALTTPPPPPPPGGSARAGVEVPLQRGLGIRYWLVWLSTVLSGLGDGIVYVAIPLVANRLTDNELLVASVTAVGELPWLLVALPAGTWLDRGNQRSIMQFIELSRMAALWALCLMIAADRNSIGLLLVVAFVLGSLQTAYSAGAHAVLPQIVRTDQLVRANGFIASGETAANSMAGPALGGLLFAAAASLPFLVDGASFAVSAVLLTAALPLVKRSPGTRRRTFREDLGEGVSYFRQHQVLRTLAVTTAVLAFAQAMVMATLVLLVRRSVGLSDTGFGFVLAVGAIGSIIGGVTADRIDRRFGTASVLIVAGLIASAGYVTLGAAGSFVPVAIGIALEGFAVTVGTVSSVSLRQRLVPPAFLGRVGNIFRLVIYGLLPIGALAGGALAAIFGNRSPMFVAGIAQASAMVVLGPRLRRVIRRDRAVS
ncbi:MAG: MFS transporter [Acidimicrobiia bacterium]